MAEQAASVAAVKHRPTGSRSPSGASLPAWKGGPNGSLYISTGDTGFSGVRWEIYAYGMGNPYRLGGGG